MEMFKEEKGRRRRRRRRRGGVFVARGGTIGHDCFLVMSDECDYIGNYPSR